ncbi:hypothetical protein OE88DRAFT_410565 [Heliocybe sulcata]|uniref:Uncharacterized protein n=1 Tax=Heliocybe sulcata TaxID=5364 RepID=A0A5C3N6E4_9AGAM|nr:hypothetical protein OE88DRAFT_410565 [Heliocybe sulcata]
MAAVAIPIYPSDKASLEHISVVDITSAPNLCQFALARIRGEVQLVQVSQHLSGSAASALAVVDVNVFRHEFISIFRYSHSTSLHPADVHIIEPVAAEHVLYEEDNGTAFLAKPVIERLRRASEPRRPVPTQRTSSYKRSRYPH